MGLLCFCFLFLFLLRRDVPFLALHGTADNLVPYDGNPRAGFQVSRLAVYDYAVPLPSGVCSGREQPHRALGRVVEIERERGRGTGWNGAESESERVGEREGEKRGGTEGERRRGREGGR